MSQKETKEARLDEWDRYYYYRIFQACCDIKLIL